ncbi:hypothetical protein BH24ACT15_BH24ACT15_01540 [soil metagenome]
MLLATGSPGRGKSLATMMLAYHLALEGGRVMLVDPKGDLQNCLNLTGVEVTSIPIHGSKAAGVLDPYHLHDDPAAAAVLAHTVLSMVLPTKLLHDNEALLLRVCDQVGRSGHPSMPAVVHALHSHADPNAAALADSIEATANLDMGRLMLGQPTSGDLTATKLGRPAKPGIQIIDVSWLANIGGTGTGTTVGQKLPYTVMYLVTLLVQQLAKRADRSMPAGVLIDEAHRISKTDLGRDLLISLTKLSRAQNVVVMLATQNMADLLDERLMTSVGVHLAFGVNDLPEAGHILKALQVSDTAHSRQDIVALRRGQAVMRDQYGRVGRIQVTPSPEVFRALTTTPPPRRRRDAIHQPDPDRPGTSSDGAEEPADTGSRMLG